jgi:dephospho-CoA kinase
VLAIGCTGGIGAGKSSVATRLGSRGAIVVDADELSREALAPGSAGLSLVVSRFGDGVLAADGSLDRRALAAIVFAEPVARSELEAIVHPFVEGRIRDVLTEYAGSDQVVVIDVALLAERGGRSRYALDGVIVVDADEATCVERLIRDRDMDEAHARLRMDAQMDRFERLSVADFVVLNIGSLAELDAMVAEAWSWILRLREELGR